MRTKGTQKWGVGLHRDELWASESLCSRAEVSFTLGSGGGVHDA